MNKFLMFLIIFVFLFTLLTCGKDKSGETGKGEENTIEKKIKILHIMSYHSPWKWTDDQFQGFKEACKDLDIEYKVFQMDTKNKSSKEWMEKVGQEARDLIDNWKPDLVYTTDDNAQIYVAQYYINKDIPFVFSAVNTNPEEYGYVGSSNMAGILEHPHFLPSVKLMQNIVPNLEHIAVLTDDTPMWEPIMELIKSQLHEIPEVEVVSWDVVKTFAEYKKTLKEYEKRVDTVALLGIFNFKDHNGNNVPLDEVLQWTAQNSRIPDFSFWRDRVEKGTLCAVTVSGYEQGFAAGKIAHGILAEGKKTSDFSFISTTKGEPIINQARAKILGLDIESDFLLSIEILDKLNLE